MGVRREERISMPLKKPTDEDILKINAETSQIVHQRFLITTIAITLFGVMIAWLIPNTPAVGSEVGAFTCAFSILITSILFTLFLVSHLLKSMLRTFTTYLIVTNKSNWERDWEVYRKAKNISHARWVYVGYSKPLSLIFIVLSIVSTFYPFILAIIYSLRFEPIIGLCINFTFGIICIILIAGMGFSGWWDPELKAKERWNELDKLLDIELDKIITNNSIKKINEERIQILIAVILLIIILLIYILSLRSGI